MLEDFYQPQPTLTWNTARGVWEKQGMANLFCEHWELFSETWQTSGTMRNGQVFGLQMPEHLTADSESSSSPTLATPKARDHAPEGFEAGLRRTQPQLGTQVKALHEGVLLRSPKASEGSGGALGEAEALKRGNTVGVRNQVMDLVASQGMKVSRVADNLLPTPNTMEHREIKSPEQIAELKAKSPNGYRNLRESVINELLPTPITRDYKDGSAPTSRDGVVSTDTVARAIFNSGEVLLGTPRANAADSSSVQVAAGAPKARLEDQVLTTWGKFEPAIRRWEELLGRPAPAPTRPDGKDNSHRLNPEFTEWMMGVPAGWLTNIGLSRVEELKACGNGVVPQQAELALRHLLVGVDLHSDKK
jgi:hypothetical protein